jgi:hypothetical protein
MKKTTAWLLAASVLMTTSSMVYAESYQTTQTEATNSKTAIKNGVPVSYKDLDAHYAKKSVTRLAKMGVLANKGDAWSPVAKMDRTEAKALFEKVIGHTIQDKNPTGDSFVRRSEVAEWLAATLPAMNTGVVGPDDIAYPFSDTDGATKAQRDAYSLLYRLGLMVGDGQGHFNPDHGLLKGDGAILAENILDRTMQTAATATFDKVEGQLPETVHTMVEENKTMPGIYSVVDGDTRYVMVAGGEVPTTGYGVILDSVSETAAGLFVKASLTKPEPGLMQGQVVSYPYQILKLKDTKKSVYLLDDKN